MRNSLLANLITNVKLKKIKLNNDIFFPSNQSTNTINLINSNNRFNNDQNNLSIINKRKIKSLKYSFSKNKRIQMPKLKEILRQTKNQGNQSEIKFRNNSDIYLPILSKNNNTNNETFVINNNHRERKIKILKKLILNGNQNLNKEIAINPVSLKLDFSSKIIKKRSKMKEKFLQRVQNYKKRLNEELIDYKHQNFSMNNTQNYLLDKENNAFNNTNIYSSSINNNVNKSNKVLSKYNDKIKKAKVFGYKNDFINLNNLKIKKHPFNDETKNNNFYTINIK
jgi:hypothetical protein